jgi:hypothetical protein
MFTKILDNDMGKTCGTYAEKRNAFDGKARRKETTRKT